jgi:hypothetical protein
MNKQGYLVWVNDNQFWHSSLAAARKRSRLAEGRGKDTLIIGFELCPYVVGGSAKRAA